MNLCAAPTPRLIGGCVWLRLTDGRSQLPAQARVPPTWVEPRAEHGPIPPFRVRSSLPNTSHINALQVARSSLGTRLRLPTRHFQSSCQTRQRAETVDECPPHKNQLTRPPHRFSGSRGSRVNNKREDGQQFSTRTAVAFVNGTETANTTRSLGITTAAFEAEACQLGALVSGICPAQDRLNHNPIHNITILSTNLVAIQAITNIRPHGPIPCSRVLLYRDADSNLLHF